jgi:hypothetical protein
VTEACAATFGTTMRIAHDRRELRHDLYDGNYAAARHERRDLRREYRDVNRDRRELGWR